MWEAPAARTGPNITCLRSQTTTGLQQDILKHGIKGLCAETVGYQRLQSRSDKVSAKTSHRCYADIPITLLLCFYSFQRHLVALPLAGLS